MIGFLIVAGGGFLFKKVTILHLENVDHPRAIRVWINPSKGFSIFYVHSIYKEHVIEEFQAEQEAIVLRGVRTKSPAVAEYYGFEDSQEYYAVNRRMKSFFLRVGMTNPQMISCEKWSLSLEEIGDKGDRVEIRLVSMTLARYLLSLSR